MSLVPKDVVILPEMSPDSPGRWLAMNVFTRTCLGVSSAALDLLSEPDNPATADSPKVFRCWEVEFFSNEIGLLEDPSRYRRPPSEWKELSLGREDMLKKFRAHSLIVDDMPTYLSRFGPKRNLLDRQRIGNFHEQHGQHFMLVRREDPATWWMKQKFTPDLKAVRSDNLYGAVQWNFLEEFSRRRMHQGMTVADIGCGTGLFSNLFASTGATVIGLDPSKEYIEVAQKNAVEGTTFLQADIGAPGGMGSLADASVDVVFMSDALLFYFCPFYPGQIADVQMLLSDIRRVLKPRGRFVSIEPHPVFYMAPWLGETERPFTVITENTKKTFGINPPQAWVFGALRDAGFAVTDLQELGPADYFRSVNPRAYYFAKQFPVWQYIEAVALPG